MKTNADIAKRKLVTTAVLISAWISPVVMSVVLPAHAATSTCSEIDIVGAWDFRIDGGNPWIIPLYPGGKTDDNSFPTVWRLTGNEFVLDHDGADFIYSAKLEAPCNSMSGTWYAFSGPNHQTWGPRGKWTATKL